MTAGVEAPRGLLPFAALLSAGLAALLSPRLAERVLAAVVAVLLLPVLLAIWLTVRLTSRGPVLVRQTRGDGRGATVARFRTTAAVDPATTPYDDDDGRRTPVGRILHALCLDELPTLLDVVRGAAPVHHSAQR